MHNRLRMLVAGILVATAGIAATAADSSVAHAAPVSVPGCPGDTAGVTVPLDDAAFANGAMVPIHDNHAVVFFPSPKDSGMASPLCGARRLADGSFSREWLYCTAADLNTCATDPMVRKGDGATGVGALTDLDRARLAWLIDNRVDSSTFSTRVVSQRLVWCVTEGAAANATAPFYYRNGTDVPLSCPDWPAIDPTLTVRPTVALTGPGAPVQAGASARFSLSTDSSPITLTADGMTGLALCPGATGATLTGGTLTIAAPDPAVPVALCATRTTAGAGTLRAVLAQLTGRTLEFWQRNADTQYCQGMLSSQTLSTQAVAASADATFVAGETTTTVPVTTAPPAPTTTDGSPSSVVLDTVTISPNQITLPRTGSSNTRNGAYWALVLLLAGVVLAAVGHRGHER